VKYFTAYLTPILSRVCIQKSDSDTGCLSVSPSVLVRPVAAACRNGWMYRQINYRALFKSPKLTDYRQWRRSVVKYRSQGQPGQAIKLFQITSMISKHSTIPVPDNW